MSLFALCSVVEIKQKALRPAKCFDPKLKTLPSWLFGHFLVLVIFTVTSQQSWADGANAASKIASRGSDTVWSIGFQAQQLALKSPDGDHLLGISSAVQLGRGWIGSNWFGSVSLDIITGPYQSPKQQDLVVDFSGTGGSAFLAYSTEGESLRTFAGNYGFLLGVSYQDIVGRSVGRRATQVGDTAVDNWVMRVNNFSLFPAIFFCWLQEKARAPGNDPASLMTRIEGYFLTIGISTPLQARYSLSFDENNEPQRSRSTLQGYSLVISLSTLLGV